MSDYAAIEKEAAFTEECVTNNRIDPALAQYDIKRGLRDKTVRVCWPVSPTSPASMLLRNATARRSLRWQALVPWLQRL